MSESIKKIALSPIRGQALLSFINRHDVQSELSINIYETELVEKVNLGAEQISHLDGKILSDGLTFHGDCLSTCAYLIDNNIKVDLVYIDPPFASNAQYGAKLKLRNKAKTDLKIQAEQSSIEEQMYDDTFTKESFLNWLYIRLLAIRKCMSKHASIYVHLDHHIGHYVKIMLDEIFGEDNFVNEIVWSYKSGGVGGSEFAKKHDTIYYYRLNTDNYIFNVQKEKSYNRDFKPYHFKGVEEFQDNLGWYTMVNMRDVWEVNMVGRTSEERVDYATQKPQALLERIIKASSNEGMIVADFFGGSGVTAKTAKELNRKFITSDIGLNAINKIRDGLKQREASFDIIKIKDGLDVFKNSSQIAKIFKLIHGAKPCKGYNGSDLWSGTLPLSVNNSDRMSLVHFVDNKTMLNNSYLELTLERIVRESMSCDIKDYVITYIFKDDSVTQQYIDKFIHARTDDITVTLKHVSDLLVGRKTFFYSENTAAFEDTADGIKLTAFNSPYLFNKIKDKYVITEFGYEFIENIQICLNMDGLWNADIELIHNDGGTWSGLTNAVIEKDDFLYFNIQKPFRMKIRDISGESLVVLFPGGDVNE